MKEVNQYIINNKTEYDDSTHFGIVIADRLDFAKEHGPFIFKIEFDVHDKVAKNRHFPALKVEVPILESYDGYNKDEAIDMILAYIKLRIHDSYNHFKSLGDKGASFGNDAANFLKGLDISKDIKFDGVPDEATKKKVEDFIVNSTNTYLTIGNQPS